MWDPMPSDVDGPTCGHELARILITLAGEPGIFRRDRFQQVARSMGWTELPGDFHPYSTEPDWRAAAGVTVTPVASDPLFLVKIQVAAPGTSSSDLDALRVAEQVARADLVAAFGPTPLVFGYPASDWERADGTTVQAPAFVALGTCDAPSGLVGSLGRVAADAHLVPLSVAELIVQHGWRGDAPVGTVSIRDLPATLADAAQAGSPQFPLPSSPFAADGTVSWRRLDEGVWWFAIQPTGPEIGVRSRERFGVRVKAPTPNPERYQEDRDAALAAVGQTWGTPEIMPDGDLAGAWVWVRGAWALFWPREDDRGVFLRWAGAPGGHPTGSGHRTATPVEWAGQ